MTAQNRTAWQHDFAFGFYLVTGGVAGVADLVGSEYLAAILSLYVMLPLLLAMPVAIWFSVKYWRDWRLPLLAVICMGVVLSSGAPGVSIVYEVTAVLLSVEWFLFRRRRFNDNESSRTEL